MKNSIRWRFLNNRLVPLIFVFALVMLAFSIYLYSNLDTIISDYELEKVERDAYDAAEKYSDDLQNELTFISTVAGMIELDLERNPKADISVMMPYVQKYITKSPDVIAGLMSVDGGAVYGEPLGAAQYKGIMNSLRGYGSISFTPSGGVMFSCPVTRGGNVKYVLYELGGLKPFERDFPIAQYEKEGKAALMTRDGDYLIPFSGVDKDKISFYESKSLSRELKGLIRDMELNTSVASSVNTTIGECFLYVAEVRDTDFVFVGVIEKNNYKGIIDRIPRIVLTVMALMSMMVIALAIFLLVSSQRLKESEAFKKAKQAAEEANKAKSDFLANMSHEIRTPINTVLGMDELILRETTDPTLRKYAFNIKRAGRSLLAQVNDVLDFSKIEAGKMELVYEEYQLSAMISDMVIMLSRRAKSKGLEFNVNVDRGIPNRLYGDDVRIRQVIINLLTNAVKYTREGSVTLGFSYVKSDEDQIELRVWVTDTGIGIHKENIEKLFTAFERIEEERNRTIEGTGLGMNIVWRLLKLMDSHLEVESEYGKGSTFSFIIRQKVIDWEPVGDYEEAMDRLAESDETYHSSFSAPEARILIVDDTEMNLMVATGLLKNTRIRIDTALDGRQGLTLTESNEYDILLIDHRMPVMDGMEMIRRLREDTSNKNSKKPCIALTANAISGARDEYIAAGFDDYLVKPVSGAHLEGMLVKYLPKELVKPADEGEEIREESVSENRLDPALASLEEMGYLDVKEGMGFAGSTDMYMAALKFFVSSIDAKSDEIKGYYDTENWEDYRTKVHGLKSSAKVIGAMELSNKARALELAANDGNLDYIREHTGEVLSFYGSYKEKLKDFT